MTRLGHSAPSVRFVMMAPAGRQSGPGRRNGQQWLPRREKRPSGPHPEGEGRDEDQRAYQQHEDQRHRQDPPRVRPRPSRSLPRARSSREPSRSRPSSPTRRGTPEADLPTLPPPPAAPAPPTGWWRASDGKWYPPDRRPPRHRLPHPEPAVTTTVAPVPGCHNRVDGVNVEGGQGRGKGVQGSGQGDAAVVPQALLAPLGLVAVIVMIAVSGEASGRERR